MPGLLVISYLHKRRRIFPGGIAWQPRRPRWRPARGAFPGKLSDVRRVESSGKRRAGTSSRPRVRGRGFSGGLWVHRRRRWRFSGKAARSPSHRGKTGGKVRRGAGAGENGRFSARRAPRPGNSAHWRFATVSHQIFTSCWETGFGLHTFSGTFSVSCVPNVLAH